MPCPITLHRWGVLRVWVITVLLGAAIVWPGILLAAEHASGTAWTQIGANPKVNLYIDSATIDRSSDQRLARILMNYLVDQPGERPGDRSFRSFIDELAIDCAGRRTGSRARRWYAAPMGLGVQVRERIDPAAPALSAAPGGSFSAAIVDAACAATRSAALTAAPSASAASRISIFGMRIGEAPSAPPCQSPRRERLTCWVVRNGSGAPLPGLRFSQEDLPTFVKPFLPGFLGTDIVDVSAVLVGGNVEALSFFAMQRFRDPVIGDLTAKFGPPSRTAVPMTNQLGASWEGDEYRWRKGSVSGLMACLDFDRSTCLVRVESDLAEGAEQDAVRDIARKGRPL